jgi:pyruvate/2-oxoglutarate dehydrogenase complex dihydrolipoamide dehydrogenase (E3) component
MFTVNFFKTVSKFTNKGCIQSKALVKSVSIKADNSVLAEIIAVAENNDINWDYVEVA